MEERGRSKDVEGNFFAKKLPFGILFPFPLSSASTMPATIYARNLCELYETYNRRKYVHPDPLEFLYDYDQLSDREIVGLVASSLAYGAVRQILKSVRLVLERMDSPYLFLKRASKKELLDTLGILNTASQLAKSLP